MGRPLPTEAESKDMKQRHLYNTSYKSLVVIELDIIGPVCFGYTLVNYFHVS